MDLEKLSLLSFGKFEKTRKKLTSLLAGLSLIVTVCIIISVLLVCRFPIYSSVAINPEITISDVKCESLATDLPAAIPHIIHQMWKSTKLSGKFAEFVESALKTHPDFKYVFWTDSDCDELINQRAIKPLREKYLTVGRGVDRADICRSLLLFEFGGIYADIDTLFVKNLGPLIDKHQFITNWEPPNHGGDHAILNFAFLASQPLHPFLGGWLDELTVRPVGEAGNGATYLGFLKPFYEKYNGSIAVTILEHDYFCPLSTETREWGKDPTRDKALLKSSITDHTYAVHMWGCSWCDAAGGAFSKSGNLRDISDIARSRLVRGSEMLSKN
eukprot:242151_1